MRLLNLYRDFYEEFAFTHPNANDYKRVAEKVSGIQLEWYVNDWTKTTKTIDYAIKSVAEVAGKTEVVLERIGGMGMPIDLGVLYDDDSLAIHYIPLQMMFGEKQQNNQDVEWIVEKDWAWARPEYTLTINAPMNKIKKILIDPSGLMADIDLTNNVFEAKE